MRNPWAPQEPHWFVGESSLLLTNEAVDLSVNRGLTFVATVVPPPTIGAFALDTGKKLWTSPPLGAFPAPCSHRMESSSVDQNAGAIPFLFFISPQLIYCVSSNSEQRQAHIEALSNQQGQMRWQATFSMLAYQQGEIQVIEG